MMEEAQRCPGAPRTEKVNHRKWEPLAVRVDADSLAKFFNDDLTKSLSTLGEVEFSDQFT